MYNSKFSKTFLFSIMGLLLVFAAPVWAQRTGDHLVPSIETVCDDDPFSFGLCNAYCEALDCDSMTPLGTPQACANKLKNYMKKSDGAFPPCENSCPCEFDVAGDFPTVRAAGEVELGKTMDPATYLEFCDTIGPNSENTFIASEADSFGPDPTPQGVALAYWIADETLEAKASCHGIGLVFDGFEEDFDVDFPIITFPVTELDNEEEKAACQLRLEELCASIDP